MEVIVDNDRGFAFTGEPADLVEAVAAVSEALKQRGRAILALKADGRDLRPEDLRELEGLPPAGVSTLEVVSEDVGRLVEHSLRDLEESVPELSKVCHHLAALFQGGAPSQGYEPFQQLAELWSVVKSRQLQIATILDIPLDGLAIEGAPVGRLHEELNGFLEEAARALQTGDCVTLGDLLEYELAPRAEQEAAIVEALRSRIRPQPSA